MIESTSSETTWADWCAAVGVDDLYWSWPHLALWAAEWSAEPVGVRWSDGRHTVLHPVLRTRLDRIPGGSGRCDVRTAYDFGGPWWIGGDAPDVAAFERAWEGMLRDWGAITEFLRLHPFRHSVLPSSAEWHCDNHVVSLIDGYEAARARYYGSLRRDLQKAERRQLEVAVSPHPSGREVEAFERLYTRTMRRLEAPPWYLFGAATLAGLFALDGVGMITVYAPSGEPAAAVCVLHSGRELFYHLSASDVGHRDLHPNHLALDAMARLGCAEGCEVLHLGGGAPSLRRFKSRLASGTVPYYVVRRILDDQAYGSICQANGLSRAGKSFPAWVALAGGAASESRDRPG